MADIEKFVYYSNGSKKVLKPTDRIVVGSGGLAFEGTTDDDFEIQLTVTDPTDDRTINFPDEDGDIALLQSDALPKALSFPVKNPSTTTALSKGQLVYISGHSGNKPEVSLAQSNSSATMPAFGFVQSDIAAEAEGYVVYSGLFKGIDTNTLYSEGDTLYVSSTTAGEFQNSPPTGSNLIQNIGKIVKSDSTNGEVLVGGAGRTNATPNLNEGNFFIGNASNQSVESSYKLPTSDGTSGQVLTTNGSGQLTFANSDLVNDTTPQLGGNLDPNNFGISGHLIPSAVNTYHLGSLDAEWGNLYLGDNRIILFGNDADVKIRHVHNAGLRVEMSSTEQSNNEPSFTLYTALTTISEGPKFIIHSQFASAGDTVGNMQFQAGSIPSANIRSTYETSTNPYGTLKLNVRSNLSDLNGILIEGQDSSVPKIKISDAYYLPTSDGTANQVLQTDGSGNLSFATPTGIAELVDDTTPQLGGNLDPNSFGISGHLLPSAVNTYDLGNSSAEWRDLYMGDNGRILFGNDSDIKLQHLPDTGLVLYLTQQTASKPKFVLSNSANTTSGAILTFHKDNTYDSDNDVVGKQEYLVASNAITTPDAVYVETSAIIKSNSDSLEEGKYDIKVSASGLLTTGLTVEPINNSSTPSVKISDSYYLPKSSVSEGQILKGSATSGETTFGKLSDTIMAELSIPGLDLQTDTNAFRFNCPVDIDIVGLDLYLDQHSTTGNVTVTVTNTTTSSSIQSLTISGTSLSANAYPYTTASAGDVITFAITATPANAQGLRAVLHIERKA
jgi:hypothetical protein